MIPFLRPQLSQQTYFKIMVVWQAVVIHGRVTHTGLINVHTSGTHQIKKVSQLAIVTKTFCIVYDNCYNNYYSIVSNSEQLHLLVSASK